MTEEVEWVNLWVAIFYALATGVGYSTNAVIMRHLIKNVGFTAVQLNIDGFALMSLVLLALFFTSNAVYSVWDLAEAIAVSLLSIWGTVCLAKALSAGKGGPI